MSKGAILLDTPTECEVANGFIYIIVNGERKFAYPPHIARVSNERFRRALAQLDAENAGKIVAFK